MPRRIPTGDSSQPQTLREALHVMVHESAMPAKQQADELGISYSYLCNAANVHLDGQGFDYQLRHLIPHTRMTDNYAAADFLERAWGRVGVFLPSLKAGAVPPATVENLPTYLCRLMKEIGDVARVSEQRLGDHDLSEEDRVRIRKEVQDVIQKAVQIDVALRGNGA
jgi:hypothetical protein